MFADDVKIIGDPCQQALQEDLTKVYHWTVDWELPLNVSKCLLLGSEGDRTLPLTLGMDTLSTSVTRVSEVRDLGIKITNDFKPSRQCAEATRSGHWALTRLKRTVSSRKPSVLLPLYKTFVRPHLEYAVQAWAPYLKKDILAIERVQRRFTRLFPNLRERDYETRLYELQLFSMERRRLRGDLIEAYKIIKGFTDSGGHLLERNVDTRLRGNSLKLKKHRARLLLRHNCFSNRVVNYWNKLPEEVVQVSNVTGFKHKLDNCWSSLFPDIV
jgi:hypothetical protein